MALSRERMVDRMLASDPAYNGRFFTGVLTTGIYCLPSCHARKPKPENVRFFGTTKEARAAGLRPCKICKPDEFEKGVDPDLDRLEAVASQIRQNPGRFPTIDAIADELCAGASVLNEQFREHFQTTPGTYLLHSRIDAACRRLAGADTEAIQIGYDVGFESTSGFYDAFRRVTGMTPAGYRALSSEPAQFEIHLPPDYPLEEMRQVLARDQMSVSEHLDGDIYRMAFTHGGAPQLVLLNVATRTICVNVCRSPETEPPKTTVAQEAYRRAIRVLHLRQDPKPFERHARSFGLERLVAGREGLRLPQTPSIFEGIVWVILGQQVNFRFAATLRRRLTERVGTPIDGLFTEPLPAQVANLSAQDLVEMQFSRQKAEYLLGVAHAIVSGDLDLDSLEQTSVTSVSKRLTAIRGFGVWSVNYLMMRALGFCDCVPLGDTGLSSGLKRLLELDHRPDAKECGELMKQFAPYRSLATYHLWRGFGG